MRATILSRYPRVDTVAWKRNLAGNLLNEGVELTLVYSRATFRDQLEAGLKEFGVGIVPQYLRSRRPGRHPDAPDATEAKTLAAWAREHGVPVEEHRRLGSDECLSAIKSIAPDVIVLAGADIVPESVLRLARIATINGHYGLLPQYRGMNVTEWSIWHDDPVGVTVHTVDSGIDTGDILLQETIGVERGDTLHSLRAKHQISAARLLAAAVSGLEDGSLERRPQLPEEGRQYYRMHPELKRRVETKLATGAYRHMGRADVPGSPFAR